MYIYIAVLLLLTVGATFPLWRGYLRRQKVTADVRGKTRRSKTMSRRAVKPVTRSAEPAVKPVRRSFKAASVHGRPGCCQAAKDHEETRFLLDDLPTLPLEACDRLADCQCSFTNHSDRRNDEERRGHRRAFEKTGVDGDAGNNRRSGLDRRSGIGSELQNIKYE